MAVFMINICKFNGCGITFPSLGDLIQHIEDTHIDYDPIVVEAKEKSNPSCLPLSYVLRFFLEDEPRKEGSVIAPDVRRKLASIVKTPSVRSNTPTGSEFDDEEMLSGQSEDSNDSWTNVEEFSSEFILRYGSRMNPPTGGSSQGGGAVEKPFACPVPGCKKRYKNVNGIKYHSKNGHKKDGKIRKGYKCHCGKSYRSAQGLKTHSVCQHFTSPSPTSPARVMALTPPSLYTQVAKPLSLPVVKALQGLVVQSSQNQINTSRHVTQVIDATHFDGNKVIRAVLESAGNKPTKEGSSSTITTLTLPRQNITTLQIANPNVLHHPKTDAETTPTSGEQKQFVFKTSPSTQNTHVYADSSVSPNSLGILTPASSPRASPHDKMKTNFPLTPVTPSNETHPTRFTLPTMMH